MPLDLHMIAEGWQPLWSLEPETLVEILRAGGQRTRGMKRGLRLAHEAEIVVKRNGRWVDLPDALAWRELPADGHRNYAGESLAA